MPPWVQQLGVFSAEKLTKELERSFYRKMGSRFALVDYAIHAGSSPPAHVAKRDNFTLELKGAYEEISKGFNKNRRRIIKRGFPDVKLDRSGDPNLFLQHLGQPDLTFAPDASSMRGLKNLVENNPEFVRVWNVHAQDQWVGGLVWLADPKRITYLFPAANKRGRSLGVPTFLLNSLIRSYSGTDMLLDLEGSMLPGVAHFYKSFGSRIETYYFLKTRCYGLF